MNAQLRPVFLYKFLSVLHLELLNDILQRPPNLLILGLLLPTDGINLIIFLLNKQLELHLHPLILLLVNLFLLPCSLADTAHL